MDIIRFRYNDASAADRIGAESLVRSVWSDATERPIHRREMDAMSFCAVDKGATIGYAGVISWNIAVGDRRLRMCGLSCVCTRWDHRRRGVGTRLVGAATEWIVGCGGFDVGLFTCSPEHVPFYEGVGLWRRCSTLVLRESGREGAYASDSLGVEVFKLLISDEAMRLADYFENSIVDLDLPAGEFV